jgi:DnaJ-class molecular chaperone
MKTCETCNGSGLVAYGPWGSRPPRKSCPECLGAGVVLK